jgi:hypothetical protein
MNKTTDTLTCNPGTLTETRDTCLPASMITRLVRNWNERNPDKKIQAGGKQNGQTSKREVWINLRKAMQGECNTEFCAVKKLVKDDKEKKQYQKYFRPEAPKEWESDPDTWLSTDNIEDVMEQYEIAIPTFEFVGPVPIDFAEKSPDPSWGKCIIDEMCKLDIRKMEKAGTEKIGICFNFDPHDKPGSHWVAAMIDLKEKAAYYYNSYGEPPPPQIAEFLEKMKQQGIKKIVYNDIRHQKKMSECGMYSIYFLVSMLFGKSFKEICLDEISDERMLLLRKIFFSTEDVSQAELTKAFKYLPQTN